MAVFSEPAGTRFLLVPGGVGCISAGLLALVPRQSTEEALALAREKRLGIYRRQGLGDSLDVNENGTVPYMVVMPLAVMLRPFCPLEQDLTLVLLSF
jgi:hypothetical protein